MTRTFVVALTFACLAGAALAPRLAQAIGEQTGRIKGTVIEPQSGVGLPGVVITARSPALIGGSRQTGTNDEGRYELVNLAPGHYTVEFSYAGSKPLVRRLVVRQGETAPLNVTWTPEETGIETVAVSEPRPITKPDSAQLGSTYTADTLSQIPTLREYQDVAQLAPGVNGGDNPNIRGGLEIQNRYLVDGLDITDPVTGTFSSNLNFDSQGSVEVITGGMEAQYNTLGGVINVNTLGGSEEFHVNSSVYVNNQKFSATGAYGANLYDSVQPFNTTKVGPNESYQVNLNVGGPILHNRLWYNVGYELDLYRASSVLGPPLGAPPYNIQHPAQTGDTNLLRGKLTWAPATNHRISLSMNADPAFFNNVSGADPNTLLGVAEDRQNQGAIFSIASWDWFARPNLNTNLQAGFQVNTIEFGPEGRLGSIDNVGCTQFTRMDNCTYDPNRPQHVNLADNTTWYQGDAYDKDRRWTFQLDPSVSWRGRAFGFHDVKAGIQTRMNYRTEHQETPGGSTYTDNANSSATLEDGLCDPAHPDDRCYRRTDHPAYSVHETAYSAGIYIQDRWWTPLPWLTVVPGLRFDYGHTADRNGDTVSSLWGLGPRLALVGDLTQDGVNVFSVSYGRSNEVLSLLPAANLDSTESTVTIENQYDPTTKKFVELFRSGGPGGIVLDKNLTTPHADEITANLRRQMLSSTVAGIDYTWKRVANYWDAVEINQVWDPSGSRVVDWADPNKKGQEVFLYTTPSANHRTYQGVDLYTEGRPTPRWDLSASYTLSWLYGPGQTEFDQISPFSQFANPRTFRYFSGFLPEDVRHQIKFAGSYQIGPVTLGTRITYETGVPRTKRFFGAQDGDYTRYRSPLGTEPGAGNDITQISEFRLPDTLDADVRVVVNVLPARTQQRLRLIADIFNVFDSRTPVAVTTTDISRFGQVAARQSPFSLQLAINYIY